MPFGLGNALAGVARAAARLRNRGHEREAPQVWFAALLSLLSVAPRSINSSSRRSAQGDLFFPEDEAVHVALEYIPPGECLQGQCAAGRFGKSKCLAGSGRSPSQESHFWETQALNRLNRSVL